MPCKELEHKTFSQPDVIDATQKVVTMKADLTQHGYADVRALRKRYDIAACRPSCSSMQPAKNARTCAPVQFIDKNEFLRRLTAVGGS